MVEQIEIIKILTNYKLLVFCILLIDKRINFAALFAYLDVKRTSHQGRRQREKVKKKSPYK